MARPSLERIWAESPTQFEEPTDSIWTLGWEGGATKQPPRASYENWWHNRVDQLLRQLERDGAMEWLAVTPYNKWAMVNASDGELYLSIQASTGVDPVSDDGTYWLTVPDYIKSLFNAQGDAPLFGVRAWLRYNGVSNVVLGSGNIGSVSPTGSPGEYSVLFSSPMIDSNYSIGSSCSQNPGGTGDQPDSINAYNLSTTGFTIQTWTTSDTKGAVENISIQVVR